METHSYDYTMNWPFILINAVHKNTFSLHCNRKKNLLYTFSQGLPWLLHLHAPVHSSFDILHLQHNVLQPSAHWHDVISSHLTEMRSRKISSGT